MADKMTSDVPPPEVTPAPAAPQDDFVAALKEFEEWTGRSNGDGKPPAPDPREQIQETRGQLDAVRELGELRQWALGVEGERLERREREESEAVFAKGREIVADFENLPRDYAERWLRAEYAIDPELNHAWNNRHESPDAMRRCQSGIRRAMDRLREAAKQVPDVEATATRGMIAAAMLRGTGTPPPSAPVDYSKMTDKEFSEAVKKEHGFSPI